MATSALKRKLADGTDKEYKSVGKVIEITPAEGLKDKWALIPSAPSLTTEGQKTLDMLEERLSAAKQAHIRFVDVANACYLQYRSINYYNALWGGFPSYWNQWGANIFIPRTFEVVEAMRAQLKSREPDWSIKPLGQEYAKYKDQVQKLSHSEWHRSHSTAEAIEALDDAIMWGNGYLINQVVNNQKTEKKIIFDADGNLDFKDEVVTKYYGIASTRIDPYDFFPEPNPNATRVNHNVAGRGGLSWCFMREIVDVEDLRAEFQALSDAKAYGVTDNYKYLKPGGDLTDYKYIRTYIDELYQIRTDMRYPATLSDEFGRRTVLATEVAYSQGKIEKWTYFEDDRKIEFAMGLILRDMPNPLPHKKKPISKMSLFSGKTFRSVGIPELMRWLQILENVLYDSGLSNLVMGVHKMFAVNERYLEDEGDLVVRPFGIVRLKNLPGVKIGDAIQQIEFEPLHQDYFNFLQLNGANIKTMTGSSEFATGGATRESKNETATVANRIVQGGMLRAGEIARKFETELIADAVEQHIANMQMYYQIDIGGEDGIDVEVSDGSFLRFLPRNVKDMTAQDLKDVSDKMTNEGYKGIMTLDQIQGSYRVEVRGGSSMTLDPDDEADREMKFIQWAATVVDPDKAIGRDPKTGQLIGAPLFDIKKIALEGAREIFDKQNAEDYLYQSPADRVAAGSTDPKDIAAAQAQQQSTSSPPNPPATPTVQTPQSTGQ